MASESGKSSAVDDRSALAGASFASVPAVVSRPIDTNRGRGASVGDPATDAQPPRAAIGETAPIGWLLRLPYPFRNVLRRWASLLGMMLGVGISLSIVMTILAMSQASLELYTGDYRRSGANLYAITSGGKMIAQLPGDTPGLIRHARQTLSQVRGLAGVDAAVGLLNGSLERERPGPKRRDEPTELVATVGVDGDPTLIRDMFVLKAGRWLRRANEIVIGDRFGREKGVGLGDSLRLNGREFAVVGIGKLRGVGFSADSLTYLDYRALRQRADAGDVVNVIILSTNQADTVRNRLSDFGSVSLTTYTPTELIEMAEQANESAVVFRWMLGGLALAVAALFVGNTLTRSVAERRLEFATLRAIGVPRSTILQIVAGEAFMVSAIASAVGVGLSLLMGLGVNNYIAPQYGFESFYSADAGLFAGVFALAIGLGLLAGLFPARQAINVDPVDVLREA